MEKYVCAECRNGEIVNEPAHALVSHPNPDRPNLRVRKWVCGEHLTMLQADYGRDVRIEREA